MNGVLAKVINCKVGHKRHLLRASIKFILTGASAIAMMLMGSESLAKGGAGIKGSGSISVGYTSVSAVQGDLNSVIDTVAAQSSISTKQITSAYELFAQYVLRFDGTMFAVAFRPAMFSAGQTGSGASGDYNYKLSGFSVFPLFRIYPLENSFIHFYMQGGLGWGKLSGNITQAADSMSFEGSNYGAMGGMGVDFCFTDSHCLTIEGNGRYLPIERNMASSAPTSTMAGFTQTAANREVEVGNRDMDTTMSGVQGTIAYTFNF